MFTIEIRVNGALKTHIYGRNLGDLDDGRTRYSYEYYETETGKVQAGEVHHFRDEGIMPLVSTILEQVKQ